MKKFIVMLSLCLFFIQTIFSQIVFNNQYIYNLYPGAKNIFELSDTGYVAIGGAYIDNTVNIAIIFTDENGNYTGEKHYGSPTFNTYHAVENACVKIQDNYILVGSRSQVQTGDTCYIQLFKFNEIFDTIWTKKYFIDTNWVSPRGMCPTGDGGFMIVGETELKSDSTLGNGQNYGLMLKVDSLGNYQWFKSFGTDDSDDSFWKVVQTHDGGYLVAGATASWQESLLLGDRGDWYVVKTDNQGNEEWSRRYGSPQYDDDRPSTILMSSDTSYYITGAWTYGRNSTGSNKYYEPFIVKLDKNFDEVYQLKYDNHTYYQSYIMAATETADHNIAYLGVRSDDGTNWYWPRGTLHKITPEGEILWQRQYVAGNDTTNDRHMTATIKQTNDGGFIFGGWNVSSAQTPNQQMWLVKTDSLGCDGTDWWPCGAQVQINPTVANSDFKMYPNPSKNILFLEIMNDEFKILNAEIYELTGKLVKSFPLEETEKGLNISSLPKGLYFVKLGEQTQKLVVE